jgi:hypothetical protein
MEDKKITTSKSKVANRKISANFDPLGIKAVAQAKNKDEILEILNNASHSRQALMDYSTLRDLQTLAQEDNSDKENRILKYVDKHQVASMIDGVVNGSVVEGSVNINHRQQVLRLREDLIKEFKADSVSELMVIDMVINAYFRTIHTTSVYNSFLLAKNGSISYDQTKINMIKELGKQIELANKQFLSTLTILKEMKQPPINIKVSGQAFVGQNQQFNKNA